jgi:transposase
MEAHDQILCEHYGRMLGLTEGWKVSGVDLRLEDKRLELRLAWERSGANCPECGASMNRHDLSPERKWRHLDSMGFETILLARIPRANCPEHGVSQMKVPWAEKHSRFTLAFEAFAIKVLQASRSVAAAQGLLRLNWESIHTIMERAVQRGVDRRSWEGVEMVGMDEKSFLRGQSYASVLYDLTPGQSRVLEVMDGHNAEAAEMLWEIIPDDVFEKIKAVCLDMSGIFASVARTMAPHIKVVHDRFHVSKHLNEAVDQVRRKESKILQAEGDERLKGAKHLFLFNPENLPESRASQFEELKNADLKTSRAWAMKENFREFWKCNTFQEAAAYFKKWKRWVMKSDLPEMKKVAKMLAKHLEGLLNFTLFPITNAVAEGFNSKIQSLKADARGFRNALNYRTRILFYCGRLDLFPYTHEIP